MKRAPALATYILLAAVIVGLDLWSKQAVFDLLGTWVERDVDGTPRLYPVAEYPIFDGWFSLEAAINFGAFSGWFSNMPWLLVGVSLVALAVTLAIVAVPARNSPLIVSALGLLAGGAIGNLYDRFTVGAVRDFLKVYYGNWVWPNFNIADSAICTGVGLLFLRELLLWRKARAARPVIPAEAGTQ